MKKKRPAKHLKEAIENANEDDIKKYLEEEKIDSIFTERIKHEKVISILIPYMLAHFKERQDKLKISSKSYANSVSKLLKFQFTIKEANQLILRRNSNKTVSYIIKNNEGLIRLGYTCEEIRRVATHNGGSKNLKALMEEGPALLKAGYSTKDDLIRILANDGGSKNLKALKEEGPAFVKAGYLPKDLMRILAHNGGSKNLKALQEEGPALRETGYSTEDLIRILAKDGGSKNLKALREEGSALQEVGYSTEDLMRILAYSGGSKNLKTLKEEGPALREAGYSTEDLIRILAHIGGSKNLEALKEDGGSLRNIGYSTEDLIRILANDGGSKNLKALKEEGPALLKAAYSMGDLIRILAHHGGSKNLKALKEEGPALRDAGYLPGDLIRILANGGGSKNLKTLKGEGSALRDAGYLKKDLISILAHSGGSKNLKALKEEEPTLLKPPYFRKDLMRILAHNGGSKNLKALKEEGPAMLEAGYLTNDTLIRILAHNGGSKNLKALKEEGPALLEAGYLTNDALISILAHHGGSKNLKALKEEGPALLEAGYLTNDALMRILAHHGGSKNLKALKEEGPALLKSGYSTEELIRILAYGGGSKNLKALKKHGPALGGIGYLRDKRISTMLQRSTGYRRLDAFIKYYPIFYLYRSGVEELLNVCSVNVFLEEDTLYTILSLKLLLCYFKALVNLDDSLTSWVDNQFPEKLLVSILQKANKILKDVDIFLEIKKDEEKYFLSSSTNFSRIVQKIEEKIEKFNLNDSLHLLQLLDPKNAVYYRLLRKPEGRSSVYYLDTRPWEAVFPKNKANLPNKLIKLFTKGIKDNDILLDNIKDDELIQQITSVHQYYIALPVAVIDTMVDDHFNIPAYQLILSHTLPSNLEVKANCFYLYKTKKSLEAIIKRDNKLETVFFTNDSFAPKRYDDLIQSFDSGQLYKSTLNTLSQLCFESGKGCYVFAEDKDEVFEFIDNASEFSLPRKNILVKVTKGEKIVTQSIKDYCSTAKHHAPLQRFVQEKIEPKPVHFLSMPRIEGIFGLMDDPFEFSVTDVPSVLGNKCVEKRKAEQISGCKRKNGYREAPSKQPKFTEEEIREFCRIDTLLTPLSPQKSGLQSEKRVSNLLKLPPVYSINLAGMKLIGEGTYNRVYRDNEFVYKERKNTALTMDEPQRAVRIFNEVNAALNSDENKAKFLNDNLWQQRYIDGKTPSGMQQAKTILNIFVKTRRLLIDGYCKDNILEENNTKKIYCPDPGLMVRRGSLASNEYWYIKSIEVKNRREIHYSYMYKLIKKYRDEEKTDSSLPIFCILGLDYYDQFLWEIDKDASSTKQEGHAVQRPAARNTPHALTGEVGGASRRQEPSDSCSLFSCDSVVTLGIAVYASFYSKRKLKGQDCLKVLKGDLNLLFSLEKLLKYYGKAPIDCLIHSLSELFITENITNASYQFEASPTIFRPKKRKLESEQKKLFYNGTKQKKLNH